MKHKHTCGGCKRTEILTIEVDTEKIVLPRNSKIGDTIETVDFVREFIKKNYTQRGRIVTIDNQKLLQEMRKKFGLAETISVALHHLVRNLLKEALGHEIGYDWEATSNIQTLKRDKI